ncbi:MAG: hypothetical protein QOD09_470 [Bradyrhizobium sp.]|jgi:hypothetical protein|nr:hypothetical protein [Bradyrhizobium sp.]MEA2951642.1 hypothetical protein [Alphaproteobacteria bacterium]
MSHRSRERAPGRDIRDLWSTGYRSRVSLRSPGLREVRKPAVHELVNVYLSPVPKTSLILLASCPMRERFLETILRTERELAGPGAPGTVDGLVVGGALGGAAPCLGRARFTLPREVGSPPASGVPHWASWRLPPLHPPACVARGILQTSDALRRENAKAWLFETTNQKLKEDAATHSASARQ